MNTSKLLVSTYLVSVAGFLIGTWAKLTHQPNADTLLLTWMIPTIIFVAMAVMEIFRSEKIQLSEKVMWVVGFIFVNFVTGLLYLLIGRKRVIGTAEDSRKII